MVRLDTVEGAAPASGEIVAGPRALQAGPAFASTPEAAVKVVVLDADPLVRHGLLALIDGTEGFSCLGAFPPPWRGGGSNAEGNGGALSDVGRPDVVLLDLCDGGNDGVEAVREIRRELPGTAVVVFATPDDEKLIFDALSAGVEGCLVKPSAPARILEAIREVHQGGSPISSAIASRVVRLFRAGRIRFPETETLSLTPREVSVLRGLSEGRSYKQIAEGFSTSVNTVRFHIRNLYEKLHAKSQAEAVAKGLRMGLI